MEISLMVGRDEITDFANNTLHLCLGMSPRGLRSSLVRNRLAR
jgi:hypothetical protein